MHTLLQMCFADISLAFDKVDGESFDGAANMRSENVGLHARISEVVHIWCYCHILNLCVADCCDVAEARNLFGLLNGMTVFIGDSYKRMLVWYEHVQKTKSQHERII